MVFRCTARKHHHGLWGGAGSGSRTRTGAKAQQILSPPSQPKPNTQKCLSLKELLEILPPAIASLKPQYIQVHGEVSPPIVDIQTSGGFQRQGLLMVFDSTASNFVPQKGRDWRLTKIADFVFAYPE